MMGEPNRPQRILYCGLDPRRPGPYGPYLLPHILSRAALAPERYALIGAAFGRYSVGAAAVSVDPEEPGEAALESLFVDPGARGRGVGTHLARFAARRAAELGAAQLSVSYALPEPELSSMDRITRSLGGQPEEEFPVYTVDSRNLHDSPLLGWTMGPNYLAPAQVIPFSRLSRDQIERLNANEAIPPFLRPASRAGLTDRGLSHAWVEQDEVLGYLLISRSGPRSFAGLSAWCAGNAPGDCYTHLLCKCIHTCFYTWGGDFLFHLHPINRYMEDLLRLYVGDAFTRMDSHAARFPLPAKEPEEG